MVQKWLFLLVFGLLTSYSFAGDEWPYTDYAYARVYAYNFDDSLQHNHQLVKDGKLDPSILGRGHELNDEHRNGLLEVLNGDVGLLLTGLSKCYLPHHGIVFFDESDKPVASATFCFLCDAIRMYPEPKDYSTRSSSRKISQAEELIGQIKGLIEDSGLPVYDHPKDYHDAYTSRAEQMKGTKEVEKPGIIVEMIGMAKPFYKDLGAVWADTVNMKVERAVKYSAGGEKYYFLQVQDGANDALFWTSREGNELNALRIYDPRTHLLVDVHVGMNTLYMMEWLELKERPEFGKLKVIDPNSNGNVVFKFDRGRLTGIVIEVI